MVKFYNTPRIFKYLFPSIIWKIDTDKKELFITFDDGPHKTYTAKILDILSEYNAKATFFMLGQNAERLSDLVREVKNEGHTIGNHFYSHEKIWFKKYSSIKNEIDKTDSILRECIGINTHFVRPPYGTITPALKRTAREVGKQIVLWTTNSYDFLAETTLSQFKIQNWSRITPGSILLFHDGHENCGVTIELVRYVLECFSARGFSFRSL